MLKLKVTTHSIVLEAKPEFPSLLLMTCMYFLKLVHVPVNLSEPFLLSFVEFFTTYSRLRKSG